MLLDLFTYLTTPCSSFIRRMGYLNEAIEMRGRSRHNMVAWQPHLDNTRRFILSAAEKCRNRNKAVILGSGLLLDVPLAELSSLFQEVVLMDVVCLPEARKQIGQYNNVRFIECDVTGVAEDLFRKGQRGLPGLPESEPFLPAVVRDAGLVVSLNILSQLWVVPRAYASQRMRGLDEYAVDEWCGRIVAAHYALLRSLSCDVCLVADHEFVKRDSEGMVVSRGSTVYGLELPRPDASWTWNIAPIYKGSRSFSKDLAVGAWHIR
ncbi:MAG: hypothetical protein H6R44_331 [Nitrospirae bacterium]|jgi:hypothetical protein|nr:hypothetical protein [Nitrospirota bacterium]